jgi:Ribonuclease G/E
MSGRHLILGTWQGREAAALVEGRRLEDLLVAPPPDAPLPGAIYRAIADRPMKGLGGVMLRLPDRRMAFLRQTRGIAPGASLLVQVSGHAEDGKAVPVTARLLLKGRSVIVTPGRPGVNLSRRLLEHERHDALRAAVASVDLPEGAGMIVRSAACEIDDATVRAEAGQLAALARELLQDLAGEPELLLDGPSPHEVAWRDWGAGSGEETGALEDHDVADLIEAMRVPRFDLPAGAWASIEPTRAFVAVDVNVGSDASPAAALKADIAAARDLPRQLRCRGLGGQITVDFAPVPKRDRTQIEQALARAFRGDGIETSLAGWTPLSHFELQRKRERLPFMRSDWS